MKFLVTGGAGFIGSALIRHLVNQTEHQVVNVDKLTYAANLDSLTTVMDCVKYSFERVDICDRVAMTRIFHEYQPDAVLHLAAESHVDRSIDNPAEFVATNVVGTLTLLELAQEYYNELDKSQRRLFRFLHVSTDEVFGDLEPDSPPFREDAPYCPSSPYSATKAASDHLVRAWYRTYGLPTIVSNCSNNYGSCQFPEKLIPLMIINCLTGQDLPVYGDGLQIRDWLYVDDHARALLQIATEGRAGESYNVGSGNEQTNLSVVHAICDLLESYAPVKPPGVTIYRDLIRPVADRPGHDRRYAIDSSRVNTELGWMPKETFNTGLEKTVRWYLENRDWWQRVRDGSYLRRGELVEERTLGA